jgi:flagellar biosynthesis GTPase FlhF
LDSIDNLQAEYDAAEKAEAEAEAVRRAERDKILATEAGKREAARRRQAAEEERRKRIAEHHTAQVKKLAKATGLSTRQAQRMIREGVKEPRRAQQMADTLGGDACYFLRAKAKPGREPDLAAHMMRARVYDTTFRDFAEDDVELAGAAADALYRMARPGDHYANLEELMTTARERGVDADAALILWHHYMLWRMRVVYDKAEEQVRDKLERQFDFG